ncbi:glycerophosphodiester phosphodiesterase family protein [Sphingomonas sp. dw_22]|uniref:glycerophosphodiester phosphodiesterase family protein n=1 Tax=Sphingomonas sp. dw_22 TaxID=2721175 RepID=UPI001BD46B96|nr:glycerophosphodiester phosphodiesterase family protein [Sphingomonas sp. dw_22]
MRKFFPLLLSAAAFVAGTPLAAQQSLPEPRVPIANPLPTVADLFACLRGKGTLSSAHRGGVGPGYPENALETAAHTLASVPMVFETDVHRSRDGVLVLMHDDTLDRTSNGTGPIRAQDWSALRQLQLKDDDGKLTPFHMPRLSDAIAWTRDRALLLAEIKESDTLEQIVGEIRQAHAQPHVMLLVNSLDDAVRVQKLDPTITMTLEVTDMAELDRYVAAGIDFKHVIAWNGIGKRDRALWKAIHDRGLTLAYGTLWYVDSTVENLGLKGIYAELASDGVDLLATDRAVEADAEIAAVRPIEPALRQCKAIAPGKVR